METQNPYARLLAIDSNKERDTSLFYSDMALVLTQVANNYNNSNGEEIYMGYTELAKLVESLSEIQKNLNFPADEITELKKIIKGEYECVLNDLQFHFETYPDEITKQNIEVGKILVKSFSFN